MTFRERPEVKQFRKDFKEIKNIAERRVTNSTPYFRQLKRSSPYEDVAIQQVRPPGWNCDILLSTWDAIGTETPMHGHTSMEIFIQVEGRLQIEMLNEEKVVLGPGDSYTVNAKHVHKGTALSHPCRTIAVLIPAESLMGEPRESG